MPLSGPSHWPHSCRSARSYPSLITHIRIPSPARPVTYSSRQFSSLRDSRGLRYTTLMTSPSDPTTPSPAPPDAIIVAACDGEWTKVAVFIARVVDAAKAAGIETTGQAVAARIYALVESGALEAKGNVRRWRAGEVRRTP